MEATLTVFFEEPFWVGVVERLDSGKLMAARAVFGAEPSDQQVYEWVLGEYHTLRFSPPVKDAHRRILAENPKRRQRQAAKATAQGVGTKAQQALQLAREEMKQERQQRSKEDAEREAERKFQLRQEKKKAKHQGH